MPPRPDPHSRFVVRLPESDLAELVLDVAAPLLERLGPTPPLDAARDVLALTIEFWNASIRASKLWGRPRVKELNELRRRLSGRQASREDAATFALLTERMREHWLEPRLVDSWSCEPSATGAPRLLCTVALPPGVVAEVPPARERRVAIGGRFLDEVAIAQTATTSTIYPVERHRWTIEDDGRATVHAALPTALQLFAEGRLPPVGGAPVDVVAGGRELGPMVLTAVRLGGEPLRGDMAVLVFAPARA